ncbi:PREDICTED: voltage-dependent calcium channel gamma-like subunit [Pygoscelis adeliae]|uniref:voltage-dependent calcium channel gamma-like subunit n=1 Tax=Pygoscelis adeliae TaxID=9238 RepID=UPI0004F4DBE3|nr:PREDICTED: voltage-dependent calcium channel gamma-like subunit [Pygoscelis adeliae]
MEPSASILPGAGGFLQPCQSRRLCRGGHRAGILLSPEPFVILNSGFYAQRLLAHRRPQKSFFETLIRSLIILCVAIAVVLSSISVCDGRWLFARGQLFGLWHFCTVSNGSVLKCVTDLSLAKVEGLSVGVIPIRSMVSFAVVVAIFGLELLMVSQVCEDANARRKWSMGSVLILGSFLLSATGVLSFSILVKDHLTFTGFTLTYWCEFIAAFLFFLNGISGLHINSLTHPRNRVGKI